MGEDIVVPISDKDKALADELVDLSYNMFCFHKQSKKTFTVCNNSKLKKISIQEDADGFSEIDSFAVYDFLRENLLEAFAELVSYSYLYRKPKASTARLFTMEVYSKYSGKKHPIFFVNKDNNAYLFDNELTQIKLSAYISNYFSASTNTDSEILEICNISNSHDSFAKRQKGVLSVIENFNNSVINRPGLVSGAITFLDFLAWKGLWQSQDEHKSLSDVSLLIENFRKELDRLSQEYFVDAKGIPLSSLISISDTIAVFTPKTSDAEVRDLLTIHANFSKYVLEECCKAQYPIRGAITYGEYSTLNNIMIGPGIDECASWHETGKWIGVHLTPTAQIYWDDFEQQDSVICKYDVPLKNNLKALYCVRWSLPKNDFMKLVQKSRALLPEISSKYINTQFFLEESWQREGIDNAKK